ncbi:MAG: hypothetical protein AAF206_29640, partial [Bacteroidota bacterium]
TACGSGQEEVKENTLSLTNDLIRQLDEKLGKSVPDNQELYEQTLAKAELGAPQSRQLSRLHQACNTFADLMRDLRQKIDSVQSVNPVQSGVLIQSGDVIHVKQDLTELQTLMDSISPEVVELDPALTFSAEKEGENWEDFHFGTPAIANRIVLTGFLLDVRNAEKEILERLTEGAE